MKPDPGLATRERILDFIRVHPQATAAGISREINRTVQDVHHHLGRLLASGQVEEYTLAAPGGRGRPKKTYRLAAQPDPFLWGLLAILVEQEQTIAVSAWLPAVAARLAGEVLTSIRNPAQRLNKAIQRLEALGYAARWEPRPAGPHLYLEFSPYTRLFQKYPQIAGFDRILFETLTGYELSSPPDTPQERQAYSRQEFRIAVTIAN